MLAPVGELYMSLYIGLRTMNWGLVVTPLFQAWFGSDPNAG